MKYKWYCPKYGFYITEDKRIITKWGKELKFVDWNGQEEIISKGRHAIRVSKVAINADAVPFDGVYPFERPFGFLNKKQKFELPEMQDMVVELYESGMMVKDIAVAFDCDEGTVSDIYYRRLMELSA